MRPERAVCACLTPTSPDLPSPLFLTPPLPPLPPLPTLPTLQYAVSSLTSSGSGSSYPITWTLSAMPTSDGQSQAPVLSVFH